MQCDALWLLVPCLFLLLSFAAMLSPLFFFLNFEFILFHKHKKKKWNAPNSFSMLNHMSFELWMLCENSFFFGFFFSIGTFSVCQRRQPEQWLLLGLWESQLQVQHSPNAWICTRVLPRKASWPHYHRSQTFQILWCRSTMSVGPLLWRFLLCPCDNELCYVFHDPDSMLLSFNDSTCPVLDLYSY